MQLLNCRRLLSGDSPANALEDFIKYPPPYAILSHTWGEGEVSLQDLSLPDVSRKEGFRKIKYCCEEALRNGINYAWVDTCCIDKTSSAILSEAINSMFRWYLNARVCYVYLQDVHSEGLGGKLPMLGFRRSRWFNRGWTLQELLAPATLIFYSTTWDKIGTKEGLINTVSSITNISVFFLGPNAIQRLRSASVAQKMSWAARRSTTRVEDMAYSLLGIFDISMPLLYGEGTRAFIRLQEEIMRQYHDHSMFAWGLQGTGRRTGMLAASPADFLGCEDIVPFGWRTDTRPPTRIPQGVELQVRLRLRGAHKGDYKAENDYERSIEDEDLKYALLNCHKRHDLHSAAAVPLRPIDPGSGYWRDGGPVTFLELSPAAAQPSQQSTFVMDSEFGASSTGVVEFDDIHHHLAKSRHGREHLAWIEHLPEGYKVAEVLPPKCWFPTNTVEMAWPWKEHLQNPRLVKIVGRKGDAAMVLQLSVQRDISWIGRLCPFARWRPKLSCALGTMHSGQSLRDVFNHRDSILWGDQVLLPGNGWITVDATPTTAMGWEMLAICVRLEKFAVVKPWRDRARALIPRPRLPSMGRILMYLIPSVLLCFIAWLVFLALRICWSIWTTAVGWVLYSLFGQH